MFLHLTVAVLAMLTLTSCASHKRQGEWGDIDYSKVKSRSISRENDTNYIQPTVLSCVDDDLINCK